MPVLTLELEDDYALVGIHSTEEDYRLAYLLNKYLKIKLVRFKDNLDFGNSCSEFPLFEFKDENSFINYYLINNKYKEDNQNKSNQGLFSGNYSVMSYLIPEKNDIDFFIKIEGSYDSSFLNSLIGKLNTINQIITAYSLEPSQLKSKNNLTF
jgi:hypothetical protein